LDVTIEALLHSLLAGGPQAHAEIKELIGAVSGRPVDAAVAAQTPRRMAAHR
jgi:hypothetical protein